MSHHVPHSGVGDGALAALLYQHCGSVGRGRAKKGERVRAEVDYLEEARIHWEWVSSIPVIEMIVSSCAN